MSRRSSGMPTMKDIAQSARVSIGTVSRVLNQHSDVDIELRERVETEVKKLGYRAAARARQIAPAKSRIVGLVLCNDIALGSLRSLLLLGIEEQCAEAGYHLLFARSHHAPDTSPEQLEIPAVIQNSGLVDCVIVAGTVYENFLLALNRRKVSYVLLANNLMGEHTAVRLCSASTHLKQVRYNDLGGCYEATRYLAQLGHAAIWFLGDHSRSTHQNRYQGYARAMEELKLEARAHTVALSDEEFENGHAAVSYILDQKLPMTAIVAGSNELAFGAKEGLRQHGLDVPKDVSLIGFEHQVGPSRSFNLTSVSVDIVAVGRQLAKLAILQIEGNGKEIGEVVVPATLIKRSTCRPLRKEEPMVL